MLLFYTGLEVYTNFGTVSYISFLSDTTFTNTATNSKNSKSQRDQKNPSILGVRGTIRARTKAHLYYSQLLSFSLMERSR